MELQLAQTAPNRYLAHRDRAPSRLLHSVEGDEQRSHLEGFIRDEFSKHFAARVREFMPTLAGLYGSGNELKAALGYRPASSGSLFLESYTNGPIEQIIRRQVGVSVSRREIVEVGSLACTGGRAAIEIISAIVPDLIEKGFSWVVFTGADTVRNVFRRLNMRPSALCIANKSMLGDGQSDWGSYYEHNPVVMAGRLAEGVVALARTGGTH